MIALRPHRRCPLGRHPWPARRARWLLPALLGALALGPAAAQDLAGQRWERTFYGTWEGREALLHNSSIFHGKLAFGDLDGDGHPDLLVGKQDGRIDRFESTGRPGFPRWRLLQENLTALRAPKEGSREPQTLEINATSYAAPALVDIDQDGDLDLFVGTGDGRLMFFRNLGNPVLAAFTLVTDRFAAAGFGDNLAPAFEDVDRNRSPDLVIGNRRGEVYLLVNQGTQRRAAFCVSFPAPDALPDEEPPCRPVPRRLLSIAPENNAAPGLVDWDGDGDPDLFVGKSNGTLAYYENKGTPSEPDWRLEQERFLAIDDGGFAAPAFLDANGDGRPDIHIGSSTNDVSLYSAMGTAGPLDVWKVSGNELGVQRLGQGLRQVLVAAGDLDGDKDLDLLVGDRGGRLLWLENVGSGKQPAWHVKQDSVLAGTVRENLAPCLLDVDGDGDLDLLLGGQDGRVWLMRNVGSPAGAQFALESTRFAGVDVGNDSVPVAVDIDGDGDLDLLVGNRRGLVIFYRNEGSRTAADFRLASTRFGGVSVGLSAAPAAFDWNADGKPDLVVGSRRGTLLLSENLNPADDRELTQWKVQADPWSVFRAPDYSAPHFADLDGDGRVDLLVADGDGNLQLWYNRNPQPAASVTAAPAPAAATAAGPAPPAAPPPAPTATPAASAPAVAAVPAAPSFESQSGLSTLLEAGGTPAPASAAEILLSQPQGAEPLAPVFALATRELGGLKFKGRVRPAFGDLDGDGRPDLVVGLSEGRVAHYRNLGGGAEAKWELAAENMAGYDAGGNPVPCLADLDGDGLLDLIVGTESGQVLFFRNTGSRNAPAFARVEDALTGVNVGRSAAPAVGLVNDDASSDLIVGDFSGHLWLFLREGEAQSLNFRLTERRFLAVDVGVAAAPFIGDIDRDAAADLLVGSDQGRVSLFSKGAGKAGAGWKPGPDYLGGIKFPFGTSPRLIDIDGDGDLDLVTGSEQGTLYLYRNDAQNPQAAPSQ